MKLHYHVMNGTPGCMPDSNEIYTSLREARAYAKSLKDIMVEDEIDIPDFETPRRWTGSKGFYVRSDGMYYIETAPCTDDCEVAK